MELAVFESQLRRDGFAEILKREYPGNTSIPPHSHDFDARGYVTSGWLRLDCGGVERVVTPGQTFAVSAGIQHAEVYAPEGTNLLVGRRKPGVLAMPELPKFGSVEEERVHRKQRLAAAYRLFSKFGFDEGVAGHITARDPEYPDTFWVNPFGVHFSQINVSNLIRCDHYGEVIEGRHPVNRAGFAIHSRVHLARPDAIAAAHSHSMYGRAWSALGRLLDPITQDACAFYGDHALYDDFGGVAVELDEGERIAKALGPHKAAILQNHGLITVGQTVDEAAWWFITMERSCHVQLLAEAAAARTGQAPRLISKASAEQSVGLLGTPFAGWFQFQPLYARIVKEQPDLLD